MLCFDGRLIVFRGLGWFRFSVPVQFIFPLHALSLLAINPNNLVPPFRDIYFKQCQGRQCYTLKSNKKTFLLRDKLLIFQSILQALVFPSIQSPAYISVRSLADINPTKHVTHTTFLPSTFIFRCFSLSSFFTKRHSTNMSKMKFNIYSYGYWYVRIESFFMQSGVLGVFILRRYFFISSLFSLGSS